MGPAVQYSLIAEPRYDQKNQSRQIVDEEAVARNTQSLSNLRKFSSLIGKMSDDVVRGNAQSAQCLTELLKKWAVGNALLGPAPTPQGEYERFWALSGISLSTLKLQRSGYEIPEDVLDWLQRVAAQVQMEQQQRTAPNNLTVWAALGTGTVALLASRDDLWEWSVGRVHRFLAQIQPDGSVPTELKRRERATGYHFFAAQPLLTLIKVSECYGRSLPADDLAQVDRFLSLLNKLQTGSISLEVPAGARQLSVGKPAWLPFLSTPDVSRDTSKDVRIPRLGGSLSMLDRASACSQ